MAVIGAGIAGASVAATLAEAARVVLLEMEGQPGYHSTGRSAAAFAPSYGPGPIRALTRASAAFFQAPPGGFAAHPLLRTRAALFVARDDQMSRLDALAAELGPDARPLRLGPGAVRRHQPLLRTGYAAGGLLDTGCADIDVNALHQGYLRCFARRGGVLLTRAEVTGTARQDGAWALETRAGGIRAATLVNAAGAWADLVGGMAGAEPIGLVPKRRTALLVRPPDGAGIDECPLVVDIDETFYAKPDAGLLLISPANEDPEIPSDVQPDEMDIALCIDRIGRAFDIEVTRIESRWAGLRSFVTDGVPVAGFSRQAEGFYWLAGQGGYGIQTAPALSAFAAAEVLGRDVPDHLLAEGLDPADLGVARFAGHGR